MTQDSSTTYRSPGADIEAIVDAPPTPLVKLSPGSQYMLRVSYSLTPPLEMIARPFHKLGGLRIDRDTATTRRTYNMFDVHITHMQSVAGLCGCQPKRRGPLTTPWMGTASATGC